MSDDQRQPGGVADDALARSVERLRAADLSSGELQLSLRSVVEATSVIFAADGAGVMLIDDQQALHYVGATDGRAAALEAAQEETGEGPCIDSLIHGQNVLTSDLAADGRWPALTEQIGSLGIRAVLGVPLRLGQSPVGSLNVYRADPYEWQPGDVRAIEAHGRIVEELLDAAMLAQQRNAIVDQLNSALRNRVTIERAVGIVMAHEDLDPVKAFNSLRTVARSRRIRVAELAGQVVATRRPPGDAVADQPVLQAVAPALVVLTGDIDLAVRDHVAELLQEGTDQAIASLRDLEVDLSEVTFMDSSGLASIAVAANRVHGAGVQLRLRGVPDNVRRLLDVTGLGHLEGDEG